MGDRNRRNRDRGDFNAPVFAVCVAVVGFVYLLGHVGLSIYLHGWPW